jgi:hypothetical protein
MSATQLLRYALWPLKTASLLVIIVFSLLLWLAKGAVLLGLPLAIALVTGFANYSLVFLDSIADGAAEPPVLSVEMMNLVNAGRAVLLLAVIVLLMVLPHAIGVFGGRGLEIAGLLLAAAVLPAMIAMQAITGSTMQMLNVRGGAHLIARLGSDYFMLVAAAAGAAGLCSYMFQATDLPTVIRIAVAMLLCLTIFAMIGGVLHERHADLGIDDNEFARDDEQIDADRQRRERDLQVDRIYAQWRGGAQSNALATIAAQLDAADDAFEELKWLYQRAAQWPDQRLAEHLAQQLLPQLLAKRRSGEAFDLLRARLKVNDHFRPHTAEELLQLATLARDAGHRTTAHKLLADAAERYPCDPSLKAIRSLAQQLER